jgi:hypothetical protein
MKHQLCDTYASGDPNQQLIQKSLIRRWADPLVAT